MSCLSRLFGLVCAVVPGLGFLILSVLLVGRWAELGLFKGAVYTFMSAITGAVCLYLGGAIVFARNRKIVAPSPLVSAPPVATVRSVEAPATHSIFAAPVAEVAAPEPMAALDSPEARIRQLALTRPNWRVTAPQLAQLANLSLSVADATARQMAQNGGGVQQQIGPNGEVVYLFDLAPQS